MKGEGYLIDNFKRRSKVPSLFTLLVLGYFILLAYLTQLVEDAMPTPVRDADVPANSTDVFSEESAWRYLRAIIGTGPRVAGTEYHLIKTVDMKDLVDRLAREAKLSVRTDWQIASGVYPVEYTEPVVNSYVNVSNVIALMEGESGFLPNGALGSTLLLNCHYDSAPFAPGASDNAAFCAVMAETLHRLSQRRKKFKHNIIFVFNGAEENPLQGSHAFLQHPWVKGVTSFVNLDAAGMNGKANLFQVSDTRGLRAYSGSTFRPSAQSFGEVLFASGTIPSDTDFGIWRDFGNMSGIDIAFIKWGNLYHTRNDRAEYLKPGVLQCAGDMFLSLVTTLADMPELSEKASPNTAVYYDYLTTIFINYPLWASYIIDACIAIVGFMSVAFYVWMVGMRWSTARSLLLAVGGRVAALATGVILSMIVICIVVYGTTQMRYLSNPWIVVPLFWIPYVIGAFLGSQLFDALTYKKSGLNRPIRAIQAAAATRLLLSTTLLIMTCVPKLSTLRYVVTAPLLLMSITGVVSILLVKHYRVPAWQQLLAELILSLPATIFILDLGVRINAFMLPVMGRSPSDTPDLTAGLLNLAVAVFLTSVLSGTELLFSRRLAWIPTAILSVIIIIIAFLPLSPYNAKEAALQRHQWFHSEIISYDTDPPTRTSGVLVAKIDHYSIESVQRALRESNLNYPVRTDKDFTSDCANYVYCNLPLQRTRFRKYFLQGLFISMPPPKFAIPPRLTMTEKVCSGTNCTLRFTMEGPPHNTLTIWPRPGSQLTAWFLSAPIAPSFWLRGRPVYAVLEAIGTYRHPSRSVHFWLGFQVPPAQQSGPIVDISHHAHKRYNPDEFTPEYKELLNAMPDYFHVDTSLTIRSNYAF